MKLKIKQMRPDAIVPTRAYPSDTGLDLYACDFKITENYVQYDTGIAVQVEFNLFERTVQKILKLFGCDLGVDIQVRPRSSIRDYRLILANTPASIDVSYTGSIKVCFYRLDNSVLYLPSQRIAQLVVSPLIYVRPAITNTLETTDRGDKGFGSSNK